MLDADGGYDSAVMTRIRCVWKKLCGYLTISSGKGISWLLKVRVCTSCARSWLIYDIETWPVKVEYSLVK